MRFISVGNLGSKLGSMLSKDTLLLSTAEQDTKNFINRNNVITFSEEGASKRFKMGQKIWEENIDRLREILEDYQNEKVILISSLGGGSGSSSLSYISKILLENNCKVFIVGVLPYKKEVNPPLANAVQAIESLMPIINKVSVMLFDNNKLIKEYENDWIEVNNHIVSRVDYILNLLSKYSSDDYSPLTLDQSELNSVIFGGGFVDFSDTFIEETNPKFEYGKLDKQTKNCLIGMFVDRRIDEEDMEEYHTLMTNVVNKYSTRVSNARMIPGILRGDIDFSNASDDRITDRCYITIASGLNIEAYMKKIAKLRDDALKKAEAFSTTTKTERMLNRSDSKKLDI